MVDDFGVKYVGKEHADHLIAVLKEHHKIPENRAGSNSCAVTFHWEYEKQELHLFMPGCVSKALQRFQQEMLKKPEDQPYAHAAPAYGMKIQYMKETVQSPSLTKAEKTFTQQVIESSYSTADWSMMPCYAHKCNRDGISKPHSRQIEEGRKVLGLCSNTFRSRSNINLQRE